MSFKTFIPTDRLKPYVKSFAISESEKAESYKILPGTSMVMGFQYSGKLTYTNENKTNPLSNAGITGLMDTYRIFNNTAHTESVLVMFSETGAAAFFNHSMHELFGKSLSLDDLIMRSQMDVVVDKLSEATDDFKRIAVIEEFLLSRLHHKTTDEVISLAVNIIKQFAGNIRIKELLEKLNISQSQFEKRFRKLVGTSPKKFASLVRLNNIIKSTPQKNGLIDLGLEAGYFDQAHFIKDFKSFTGLTPEQFFDKK